MNAKFPPNDDRPGFGQARRLLTPRQWDTAAAFLLWASAVVLALAWLSTAAAPSYALFRWIPNGYNEGWNAYWSRVAANGGALYPAVDSPISNNYPPLSFYIVGGLGRLIGDNIFAGRLLAFLSLMAVAIGVFAWLRINQVSRAVSVFGAALFMGAFATYAPAYIAMNDPQLMAHAVMMMSVVVLWRHDFSRRALWAAAVLMVAAGTIKHLLIALPVAVTVWIALYRRPVLLRWVVTAVAVLAVAIAMLYLTQGVVFFHDMASSRQYSRELVRTGIRRVRDTFGFLVVLSGVAGMALTSRRGSRDRREKAAFVLIYFVLAAGVGALAASGKGVDRNAFFELLIAASLAVALGVEHLRTSPAKCESVAPAATGLARPQAAQVNRATWGYPLLAVAIASACAVVFGVMAAGQWPARWQLIRQTDSREAAAMRIVADIRRLGGSAAACEELSLCYWAGSTFTVDFFNYGQKLATSALPPTDCETTFSAKRVSLVQVNSPHGEPRLTFRLPDSCNAAIARTYGRDINNSNGRLMLPALH